MISVHSYWFDESHVRIPNKDEKHWDWQHVRMFMDCYAASFAQPHVVVVCNRFLRNAREYPVMKNTTHTIKMLTPEARRKLLKTSTTHGHLNAFFIAPTSTSLLRKYWAMIGYEPSDACEDWDIGQDDSRQPLDRRDAQLLFDLLSGHLGGRNESAYAFCHDAAALMKFSIA